MRGLRAAAVVAIGATMLARDASALPPLGSTMPEVLMTDAWGRSLALSSLRDKPVLVIYEDKASAEQNKVLKAELARLARGDRYKKVVGLVAVADVTGYDYWPVRGFVEDAIQQESVRFGTDIFCDWNGRVRTTLGLERGVSNVVLYDHSGHVRFASKGTLADDERASLLAMLRREVEN